MRARYRVAGSGQVRAKPPPTQGHKKVAAKFARDCDESVSSPARRRPSGLAPSCARRRAEPELAVQGVRILRVQHPLPARVRAVLHHLADELEPEPVAPIARHDADVPEVHEGDAVGDRPRKADLAPPWKSQTTRWDTRTSRSTTSRGRP